MPGKFYSRILCSTALLVAPAAALAQESPAEDVVYVTAARIPLAADDATVSISALDSAMIEARGAVFVADILRAIPGLAVSRSGTAGALTQIRSRGSEANHVLVLIDGIEAANPFTGEADFAHFAFDDLGSIEVARGEQSALWGADAIGGVISLRSAMPEQGREATLRAEAGSFGTTRLSGRLGRGFEHGYLAAGVAAFETDGIDVSGLGGERDGYSNRSANFLAGRDWDGIKLATALRWVGYQTASDADRDYDGRLDNTDDRRTGDQILARVGLTIDQHLGEIAVSHELAVQLTDDVSRSFEGDARSALSEGQRTQGHYQVTGFWSQGEIEHRLTGLVEYEQDRTSNDAGPGSPANQAHDLASTAFALDYGLSRGPLDLTASARHESNQDFEDALTWRAGMAWAFDSIGGRLRLGGGEGVKNPGVFELFGYFPAYFIGNPGLKPERSRGWELAWEQGFADGRGHASVVWFQSQLTDEIYTDFAVFPATARNATSRSDRSGLELEAGWDVSDAVAVFGSATLMDSEQDGAAEIRRPQRLASLTLDWHPVEAAWSASLTVDHTGEQLDTDFGTFQTVTLDAYTLVGSQLRWQAREGVELYLRGENLLDEDYQDVFGYHTPGRGLYLGLRLRHG
ncbi:TonB-dependent receptor [uncultured Maricaulis sp.]|uniref:TonB-dependent receptor plug domain-containing protein n=1 Tax=uncultured Maricaulis sp. TaxID=174710 RepID=UPI0030D74AFA|tara:strand:- start:34137 stop:36032 length:1896 start_codon:yes stop_codon:yes gene_type:complete